MDIKELLSNKLHKSDIEEIYGQIVKDDKFDKDVLYSLINDENQKVGMNILWVMTCFSGKQEEMMRNEHNTLIDMVLEEKCDAKKRLLLTIIERQAFPKEEIRVDFLDFCMKNILSTGESASTRSLCAKMAYYQCVHYQELLSELNNVIQLALTDKLTRGIESSFKKILKKINNYHQLP